MEQPKYVMTIYPFTDEGSLHESEETLRAALAEASNGGDLENVRVYHVGGRVEIGTAKDKT